MLGPIKRWEVSRNAMVCRNENDFLLKFWEIKVFPIQYLGQLAHTEETPEHSHASASSLTALGFRTAPSPGSLPSLTAGFAPAFSAESPSLGTIFPSLSYISISRRFTEETEFEFWLHLVTLNWTQRPVIIKDPCFLLTVSWTPSRGTQCVNFTSPWNWSCTPALLWPFPVGFFSSSAVWKV